MAVEAEKEHSCRWQCLSVTEIVIDFVLNIVYKFFIDILNFTTGTFQHQTGPGENESEVSDDEWPGGDNELGEVGDGQRSVIMHIISQLRLGMDLTRVTLPTFILERRSLLEMFADFLGHPDYFVR